MTFEERHGRPRGCAGCTPEPEGDFLLLEDGSFLLLEDGEKIELE